MLDAINYKDDVIRVVPKCVGIDNLYSVKTCDFKT